MYEFLLALGASCIVGPLALEAFLIIKGRA